jgi:hypothetical protein
MPARDAGNGALLHATGFDGTIASTLEANAPHTTARLASVSWHAQPSLRSGGYAAGARPQRRATASAGASISATVRGRLHITATPCAANVKSVIDASESRVVHTVTRRSSR